MNDTLSPLISDYFDRLLSDDDSAKLVDFLKSDRDSRREFVRAAVTHQQLREAFRSLGTIPVISDQQSLRRHAFRASRLLAWAASLLLVGYFVTIVGLLAWDHFRRAEDHNELATQTIDAPAASLTRADDAVWQEQGNGRVLQVRTGMTELKFGQGASVVVQGPAEFEVRSSKLGFLRHGRLTAIVPPPAIGFTIETPTAEIVDLGTEFGVDVDATGRTDVQVLEGAVNVDYSSLDGKSKSSRRSQRMTAGSAKRFSAQPGTTDITATEIAPWLDQSASVSKQQQNLPAETKYAAAVLADRPLGYWRFSDTDGHRAMDASGHGNHGEYLGFVSTKSPGICPNTSDRSIRLLGKEYGGCVRINDFELPASCTVELWVRSATPAWNAYGWLLSCAMPNGLQIAPDKASRSWQVFIHNATLESPSLGPHPGPLNIADRFHQYAFSYDAAADRGLMYCDGALVDETIKMFGDKPRHEAARLTLYVGRLAPGFPYESWGEGFVDELAIYGEVLTPDAVKRHYEAAGYSTASGSKP